MPIFLLMTDIAVQFFKSAVGFIFQFFDDEVVAGYVGAFGQIKKTGIIYKNYLRFLNVLS